MIKILFIGDVYGRPGRRAVEKYLPIIKSSKQLDLVIVNGENSSNGSGLDFKSYRELKEAGVDFFTLGNHYLSKSDIYSLLLQNNIIRPLNVEKQLGSGSSVINIKNVNIRITNLLGLKDMTTKRVAIKDPFIEMENLMKKSKEKIHIIDIHGESFIEKKRMLYFLDGKISALLGTHTHTPTNDGYISSNKTGFISDVGFCGGLNSVIGVNPKDAINHLRNKEKKHTPAKGNLIFNSIYLEINKKNGKCKKIEHLQFRD